MGMDSETYAQARLGVHARHQDIKRDGGEAQRQGMK